MKILHLTKSEHGGAAEYVIRLNKSLNDIGVESEVMFQSSFNKTSIEPMQTRVLKKLQTYVFNDDNNFFHSFHVSCLGEKKEYLPAIAPFDTIHLHSINNFISSNDLIAIRHYNKECNIFWTVHSFWSITGGCVVPNSCLNYNDGCNDCPIARKSLSSLITYEWSKKLELIKKLNITLIPNSEYVNDVLKGSSVPDKHKAHEIIYPIIDKNFISIDPPKKNITKEIKLGFCVRSLSDINKGIQKLINNIAFIKLTNSYNVKLVLVGEGKLNIPEAFQYEYLGLIKDKSELINFYKGIDIFLHPSKSETFGMVCLEALFVKRPVIAFNIGGIPEIVTHRKNGYLAKPFDFDDFCEGVEWVIKYYNGFEDSIFNDTVSKFNPDTIVKNQLKLYKNKN